MILGPGPEQVRLARVGSGNINSKINMGISAENFCSG